MSCIARRPWPDRTATSAAPSTCARRSSDNLRALATLCRDADARDSLERLRQWEAQAFDTLCEAFAQRQAGGRVREAHGDLHLGNVAQIDGRPVLFDCLEFNADLR